MTDYAKMTLPDLEDVLVGHQEALTALRDLVAGHEYELRQAHRELERRLKRPVSRVWDAVRDASRDPMRDVPAAACGVVFAGLWWLVFEVHFGLVTAVQNTNNERAIQILTTAARWVIGL